MPGEGPYVVAPGTGRPRATIAVLHAWWGLTPVIRKVCDDLAALGYVAVAPDLYDGEIATTPAEATLLRGRRRARPMWREIVESIGDAQRLHEARALGQVGFSMGGHWALWLAKQSEPDIPQISATSVFYAVRGGDYGQTRSAFQFHLAETDPFVSKKSAARLERELSAGGYQAEFFHYPGTGHWFFEEDRPDAYVEQAARLAWERTVSFLNRHFPAG